MASRSRPGLLRLLVVLLVTALVTFTYLILSLDGLQTDLHPPPSHPSLANIHPPLSHPASPGLPPQPETAQEETQEEQGGRWHRDKDSIKQTKTHQEGPERCNCTPISSPTDHVARGTQGNDGRRHSHGFIVESRGESEGGGGGKNGGRISMGRTWQERPSTGAGEKGNWREGRGDIEKAEEFGLEVEVANSRAPRVEGGQRGGAETQELERGKGRDGGQDVREGEGGRGGRHGNTGRHVNFYLPTHTRRSKPVHPGSTSRHGARDDGGSHQGELKGRIQRASRQLRDVLELLERIRAEFNNSKPQPEVPVSARLRTGLQAAEKLINSLLPSDTIETVGISENYIRSPPKVSQHSKDKQVEGIVFPPPPGEVFCKETFRGTLFGYPFYEKGFVVDPCPEQTPLGRLITVLFNFVDYPAHQLLDTSLLVRQVRMTHPDVAVYVAARRRETHPSGRDVDFRLDVDETSGASSRPAAVWNALLSRVTTPYVFIARQMVHFDADAGLQRLVMEISSQGLGAVGGAIRTVDGRWTMGCYQVAHHNYTLVYRHGYRNSQQECLRCHYIQGPFVTRTELLRGHPLDEALSSSTMFEDYFLMLQEKGVAAALCPDAMFHVRFPDGLQQHKTTWTALATKWRLNRIRLSSGGKGGTLHTFTCMEVRMDCAFTTGLAVAPCCLELLAAQIKFIMRTCEEKHLVCELQEGTLLGAAKLGKVLPWERDGDITFLSANFSALAALEGWFNAGGYVLHQTGGTRCCVEDQVAGGVFTVSGHRSPWTVEMYGYHKTDSEQLVSRGLRPTKVFFDGTWVATPRNPGLHLRNRYGHEIYRHAQHWISLGKYNGWEEYFPSGFSPCPIPGRHDCLDTYPVDGNLQFEEPVP